MFNVFVLALSKIYIKVEKVKPRIEDILIKLIEKW